jgi:predicted  nucleic acid-binding Zn-ribbon protein
MSNEEIKTETKFAEEGKGRSIALLSDSASPVYYGFNCTPRQVRYYKVEKSVEEILKGGYTRKDVEQFLEKVKAKMCKAENKFAEYETKYKEAESKMSSCTDYSARQLFRKERDRLETKAYNYEYEVLGLYQRAVENLTKYLA